MLRTVSDENITDIVFESYFDPESKSNEKEKQENASNMFAHELSRELFGSHSNIFTSKVGQNNNNISCIAFNDNLCQNIGEYLAVGMDNGCLKIYDCEKLSYCRSIKKFDYKQYKKYELQFKPLLFCNLAESRSNVTNIVSNIHSKMKKAKKFNAKVYKLYPHRINEIDFYDKYCVYGDNNGRIVCYDISKRHVTSMISAVPKFVINEMNSIHSVQYHPSGEYIAIAGNQGHIRLYDIHKQQGYISRSKINEVHRNINQLRWSETGDMLVTVDQKGFLKIFDGRTLKLSQYISAVHGRNEVISVRFQRRNPMQLLTNGADGCARLWDIRVYKQIMCYDYGVCSDVCVPSVFTHDCKHVLSACNNEVVVFDIDSGQIITKYKQSKDSNILCLDASPVQSSFMSATAQKMRYFDQCQVFKVDQAFIASSIYL